MEAAPKRIKLENPDEEEKEDDEEKMRFDDPDPEKHDVVLVVKGQKFYCCKSTLAKHTNYFDGMFFRRFSESNQKEIELHDPQSAEDFQAFLELIHGVKSLTDENITGVLNLCSCWVAGIAINRCIDYIMGPDSELTLKQKFDLACMTSQKKLMTLLLAKITTTAELKPLLTDDVFQVDQPIIGMVFKKSIELSDDDVQVVRQFRRPERMPSPRAEARVIQLGDNEFEFGGFGALPVRPLEPHHFPMMPHPPGIRRPGEPVRPNDPAARIAPAEPRRGLDYVQHFLNDINAREAPIYRPVSPQRNYMQEIWHPQRHGGNGGRGQ